MSYEESIFFEYKVFTFPEGYFANYYLLPIFKNQTYKMDSKKQSYDENDI